LAATPFAVPRIPVINNVEVKSEAEPDRIRAALFRQAFGAVRWVECVQAIKARGIEAYQAFGTADLGLIAFETQSREGMVVNEDVIVEIVRPGTGEPVAEGDVGEIVVTSLDPDHPWIRLALGDLTAALPGPSLCGRTNMRIKGWMGRADQTTKIKGMFVRPEQIAEIGRRHPELGRLRLVVTREGELDVMTLKAEAANPDTRLREAVKATLYSVTKLSGNLAWATPQSLPNDGKVIADERS